MGSHQRVNLHLFVNENEVVPSVISFFSNADWMEREQAEMLNIIFDTMKMPLILPKGQNFFPLRKKNIFEDWPEEITQNVPTLNYNPNKSEEPYPEEKYKWQTYDLLSPETMGNFEWMVCFDPIKVVDSKVNIGFHHQGLEKLLENKDIVQIMQLVDKINLSSSPHYSVAWTKTLEEMFRIKIPERAQAIRIIMLELSRIADHLTVLSSVCIESGQNEFRLLLNAREKVLELFEKYSGHRQGMGFSKIGGVKEDLPHGWIAEYQAVADILSKNLLIIHNSLISQRNFRHHLEGEPVNAQSILQWGVSGPAMRAAGLNFDLRKSQPIYFYQDIDFDIPVGIHGSIYDRYLIRYEEIFQSLRIITQVIDNLPLGEVISVLFDKNYLEFFDSLPSISQVRLWHYSSIESPAGEAGFLIKLEGANKPERIKIKTPSFTIAQALSVFVQGSRKDQLSACMASLGISRREMDR
jgi:NADH-quinone oxidoreductase subunit C/D